MSNEELEKIAQTVLSRNEKVVADYTSGKENALMFLVGQTMREVKGKVKADTVRAKLQELLAK